MVALVVTSGHWIAFLTIFPSWLMMNSKWIGKGYYLNEKWLIVQFGFFYKKRISIKSIYGIWRSASVVRAPLVSFRRMEVHFGSDKKVVISPVAEKDFLDHIQTLNPDIQNKLKDWDKERWLKFLILLAINLPKSSLFTQSNICGF